jgi:anthranilate synthase component 1
VRHEHTPEGDKVTIRPLAGTRPRGATPERDKATEAELWPTRRSAPST